MTVGIASAILFASYILNIDSFRGIIPIYRQKDQKVSELSTISENQVFSINQTNNRQNIESLVEQKEAIDEERLVAQKTQNAKNNSSSASSQYTYTNRKNNRREDNFINDDWQSTNKLPNYAADYFDFRTYLFFDYFKRFVSENEQRFDYSYIIIRISRMENLAVEASRILRDDSMPFGDRELEAQKYIKQIRYEVMSDFVNPSNEEVYEEVLGDFDNMVGSIGSISLIFLFELFNRPNTTIHWYDDDSQRPYLRVIDCLYNCMY